MELVKQMGAPTSGGTEGGGLLDALSNMISKCKIEQDKKSDDLL